MNDKRMIRLGIVIGALQFGGTELQLLQLLLNIDRKEFTPIVFILGEEGPVADRIKKQKFQVISLNIKKKHIFSSLKNFIKILKSKKVDILYCLLANSIILGSIIGRLAGVKHIVGGIRGLGWTWSSHQIWGLRLTQFLVNTFIVNSEAIKKVRVSREWIKSEKIEVIPNGLDLSLFPYSPEKEKIIGIVGSLKSIKGQTQFIKAANILLKKVPTTLSWYWVMVLIR